VAEPALPTWAAKDSDKKVLITDQIHAKKVARHCCPHSPLIAQICAFFTKIVPLSQPVPLSWLAQSSCPVQPSFPLSIIERSRGERKRKEEFPLTLAHIPVQAHQKIPRGHQIQKGIFPTF